MSTTDAPIPPVDLNNAARQLRQQLEAKKFVLLYAHNGTGKTRLSGAFKDLGKEVNIDGETTKRDTLYFNAYTEDLLADSRINSKNGLI